MLERNKLFENDIELRPTSKTEFNEKFKQTLERLDIRFVIAIFAVFLISGYFVGNILGGTDLKTSSTSVSSSNQTTATTKVSSSSVQSQKIKVYITGEVNKPGVYEIENNSRLTDLITLAGNLTNNADLTSCNLASFITDGMKISVPSKSQNAITCIGQAEIAQTQPNSSGNEISQTSSLVNLNTATQAQLESLPGVGPSYAIAIIDYRAKNGGFKSITDLRKVKGIGEKRYSDLKDLVTV